MTDLISANVDESNIDASHSDVYQVYINMKDYLRSDYFSKPALIKLTTGLRPYVFDDQLISGIKVDIECDPHIVGVIFEDSTKCRKIMK